MVERDGFVALVERLSGGGFGRPGAPGLLLDGAFAVLVWKQERAFFVAKGLETPATAEQVETLRCFDRDLNTALNRPLPGGRGSALNFGIR